MSDTGAFRIKALGELQGFEDGETFNGVFLEGSIPAIRSVGAHLLEDVSIVPASSLPILVEALEHVTELLVDTWHVVMPIDDDPEKEVAVINARAALASIKGGDNA